MSDPTITTPPAAGLNDWLKKKTGAGGFAAPSPGTSLDVDLDMLDDNPEQPRKEMDPDDLSELKESLRQYGMIQNVTVTRRADGRYYIIAGHSRVFAARQLRDEATDAATKAKWSKIRATDRGPTAMDEMAELALAENIQRSDLRPIDTAEAIAKLQQAKKLTVEALAQKLNMDLSKTKRYLQLASAPPTVREALGKGLMVQIDDDATATGKPRREHRRLEMGHAILVLRAYNHWTRVRPKKAAELTRTFIERVLSEGWPHRKLKDHVDSLIAGKPTPDEKTEGSDGSTPATAEAAPPRRTRLFQDDATKLVVHRSRLPEATAEDKASLKAVLSELLSQLS